MIFLKRNVFACRVRTGCTIFGVLLFLIAGSGQAGAVDDFEDYADTAALQVVWSGDTPDGAQPTLTSSPVYQGSRAMALQTVLPVLDELVISRSFSPPLDWSEATHFSLRTMGRAGNPDLGLEVILVDGNGADILSTLYFPAGNTRHTDWFAHQWNLNGEDGLDAVAGIQLHYTGLHFGGTLELEFDQLSVAFAADLESLVITETDGDTVVAEGSVGDTIHVGLSTAATHPVDIQVTVAGDAIGSPTDFTILPPDGTNMVEVLITLPDDDYIEQTAINAVRFATASADPRFDLLPVPDLYVTYPDNDEMVVPELNMTVDAAGIPWVVFDSRTNQVYQLQYTGLDLPWAWNDLYAVQQGSGSNIMLSLEKLGDEPHAARVFSSPVTVH